MTDHSDDCGCPPGTHEEVTAENEFLEGERQYGADVDRAKIVEWLRTSQRPVFQDPTIRRVLRVVADLIERREYLEDE